MVKLREDRKIQDLKHVLEDLKEQGGMKKWLGMQRAVVL